MVAGGEGAGKSDGGPQQGNALVPHHCRFRLAL
jgi:hypothetical protein